MLDIKLGPPADPALDYSPVISKDNSRLDDAALQLEFVTLIVARLYVSYSRNINIIEIY